MTDPNAPTLTDEQRAVLAELAALTDEQRELVRELVTIYRGMNTDGRARPVPVEDFVDAAALLGAQADAVMSAALAANEASPRVRVRRRRRP